MTVLFLTAAWIAGNAAGWRNLTGGCFRIPIGGPFPDIGDHVVQAQTVRRISPHRRCSLISIGEEILRWEQPLPIVSHHHPLGRQHATPGIGSTVKRSEEHTSELQSLMRISYAVFCLKKKKKKNKQLHKIQQKKKNKQQLVTLR